MPVSHEKPQPANRQSDFASTHWSLVVQAGNRGSPASNSALAALCQTYWYPLYAFARRRAANVHEAQDLTQAWP